MYTSNFQHNKINFKANRLSCTLIDMSSSPKRLRMVETTLSGASSIVGDWLHPLLSSYLGVDDLSRYSQTCKKYYEQSAEWYEHVVEWVVADNDQAVSKLEWASEWVQHVVVKGVRRFLSSISNVGYPKLHTIIIERNNNTEHEPWPREHEPSWRL